MGYELDFIPVGEGEKSGDAIAIRYGNDFKTRQSYKVVIIDAGFKDSATKLINHIKTYYNTSEVDLVVSTHPDSDHISGLETVLNELKVKKLWMHLPWKHTGGISDSFKGGRVTDKSVKEDLKKSLDEALDLEKIAQMKKIQIEEPFAGMNFDSSLFVLGPLKEYYENLLPGFRGTPEPKENILARGFEVIKEAVKRIAERWDFETLDDSGETSAENNTSTILLLNFDGHSSLFTSDAGIPAINLAINYLNSFKFDYSKLDFIQAPHHGSKRNIGPTILNTIIGPKLSEEKIIKT